MNKLTDAEIVKSLESLLDRMRAYESQQALIGKGLVEDIISMYNRQKAEIERLQSSFNAQAKLIEKKNLAYGRICVKHANEIKTAKSEAIKEFAERLKNEIISDTAYGCDCNQHSGYYDNTIKIGDIPEYIDNLVKEMAGVDNG